VPFENSTCAERLARAGGVLLGKLATLEFATGGPSYDLPWPPARNPWRLDRFPGGSSSGAGAAVAAGLAAGALGSDTGGSIRLPAAYCGLVGLKPTYGRVSKRGVIPLSWTLDNCGPLTWTVRDAAMVLQVIAGFDPADPSSANVAVPDFSAELQTPIKGLKIGIVRHLYEHDVEATPETIAAMESAFAVFRDLGAELVEVELPPLARYQACYRAIVMPEAFSIHEATLTSRAADYGAHFRFRILSGGLIEASDYVSALRAQRSLREATLRAMDNVDVLLTATTIGPAPVQERMSAQSGFTTPPLTNPFNVAQCPAVSLCNGFSSDGLPLAMQIVARPFAEARLLGVASAYEAATDWREERPALRSGEVVTEPTTPRERITATNPFAALAQRVGITLDEESLEQLVAVMPHTDTLIESVRGPRHYGDEPDPTFSVLPEKETGA
jgi:aspartyl-tRNA(Asn)/glutamyl-tRNA(Gln) amidotransferase subunit A